MTEAAGGGGFTLLRSSKGFGLDGGFCPFVTGALLFSVDGSLLLLLLGEGVVLPPVGVFSGRRASIGLPGCAAIMPGPLNSAGCGVAATVGWPWFCDSDSAGSLAAASALRLYSDVAGM